MSPPQLPSHQTTRSTTGDQDTNKSIDHNGSELVEQTTTVNGDLAKKIPNEQILPQSNVKTLTTPKSKLKSTNKRSNLKAALKKYWWVAVLGVVLAGGVTVLRSGEDAIEETPATEATTRLSVRTTQAQREPIRAWVSSEGNVRAVEYKHLSFEVEGDVTYLARRNGRRLREGDRVTAGELLARVDDRELLADVRQAEAALIEARQNRAAAAANVAQVKAQVSQARARLQKARTSRNLAQSNLDRYRLLVEQGAVSESEFETRSSTFEDTNADVEAANADVNAAQAQVTAAEEQLEATRASITTAEARLEQAEVALEGASIYAPFNGIVAYLNYTEGEYFTPQAVTSQLGGDYQGILERIPMVIIDPSQYEVIVDLASPSGEQVQAGQTAYLASDTSIEVIPGNDSNQSLIDPRARGEVFSVNPAISPGGRAIEARIRLDPQTTQDIRHGEQVLTWIAVEEDLNATVVPLNAVIYRDQIPYVFVVNSEEMIEQRQVELGIRGLSQQQIIRGVEVGESVVIQGQNRLVDGAPVQIVNPNL